MKQEPKAKLMLVCSMLIFGTVGVFRKFIPMSSGFVAFTRGIIGTLFLVLVMALKKSNVNKESIKKNSKVLIFSGAAIGFNWILLFESYKYTSVATATLCYYMAPLIVTLCSQLFGEKLTVKKIILLIFALFGMALVSNIFTKGQAIDVKGILLGLGAAVFYALVIMSNKKISGLSSFEKTSVQLFFAGVSVLIYSLLFEKIYFSDFTLPVIILTLIVGVIHTGFAYTLYFGSISILKTQTTAILSYIDPVFAIILSALILKEPMTIQNALGAIIVIASLLLSEITENKKTV